MSAVDLYSRGIRDALDLVRQLRVRVVTEERKARGRYRAERALVKAAGVRLATTRAPPVAISILARIPLLGHPFARRLNARAGAANREMREHRDEANKMKRRARERSALLARVDDLSAKLAAFQVSVAVVDGLPEHLQRTLAEASNRARQMRSSRMAVREDRALACAAAMATAAERVSTHVADAAERAERAKQAVSPTISGQRIRGIEDIRRSATVWHPSTSAVPPMDARQRSATMARRIYLPIAANDAMAWHARQAGAHRDPAAKGSQMYVTGNDDWSRLQSLLPLAIRDRSVVFDFPPIPRNAAGHNLHTVFTSPTWRFISSNAHTLVGYRCQICGEQRGQLLKLTPGIRHANALVDCHEIWEWHVPDSAEPVGVQRLRTLCVVCVDCHMTFHEDVALSRGRQAGREEDVRAFLDRKRRFINRMSGAEMAVHMERNAAQWREAQRIEHWILDLSHLTTQNHLQHFEPVMIEDNVAGIGPSDIAGIDFVTDSGDRYRSRAAMEIYEEIVDVRRRSLHRG